jgi:hypothetical protein
VDSSKTITRNRIGGVAVYGLALAVGWTFHGRSIVPLRQIEKDTLAEIVDLRASIKSAKVTIAETRTGEQAARLSMSESQRPKDGPSGKPASVWLPALVKEHFTRLGIAEPVVRLNMTEEESAIPGYERAFWFVSLPIDEAGRNIATILLGVADLDQRNPLVRVLDFAVQPDSDDPMRRVATFNLTILSPKPSGTL